MSSEANKQNPKSSEKEASGPPPAIDVSSKPSLGVIRLDYDYAPILGDIDCPGTFKYPVHYKAVSGLTFKMCQQGELPEKVKKRFLECIHWLIDEKKASVITGDCGFMIHYQQLAQTEVDKIGAVPIVLSPLMQLNMILSSMSKQDHLLILTAVGNSLIAMKDLLRTQCGIDCCGPRLKIVGCEGLPRFEEVVYGDHINATEFQDSLVDLVADTIRQEKKIKAVLLECTELPRYANALRKATRLPVYDTVTCCDFFIDALTFQHRYGTSS